MTLTFYVIPLPTISLSTSQPFTLIIIQKLSTTMGIRTKDIATKGSASKGIKIPFIADTFHGNTFCSDTFCGTASF